MTLFAYLVAEESCQAANVIVTIAVVMSCCQAFPIAVNHDVRASRREPRQMHHPVRPQMSSTPASGIIIWFGGAGRGVGQAETEFSSTATCSLSLLTDCSMKPCVTIQVGEHESTWSHSSAVPLRRTEGARAESFQHGHVAADLMTDHQIRSAVPIHIPCSNRVGS